MALAERQGSFHRTVIDVVYKTMNQLARTDSPNEVFELREQLRASAHHRNRKTQCRRYTYAHHLPFLLGMDVLPSRTGRCLAASGS